MSAPVPAPAAAPDPEMGPPTLRQKPIFRTLMFFVIVLCVALLLIMMGRRNDAVTQAQYYHAGVLTADEVNVAFQNVSGRLISRHVDESDRVEAGTPLLDLDESDLKLAIQQLKAQLLGLDAQIKQQASEIENQLATLRHTEEGTWREIEDLSAQLEGAIAAESQTEAEYRRYSTLRQSSNVSASAYDNARSTYLQALARRQSLLASIQRLSIGATPEQIEHLKTTRSAEGMTLSAITIRRSEIDNLRNVLAALEASREATAAQLELQELNLKRTHLRAPQNGKVLQVLFEEGEQIAAGTTAVLLQTDRYYYDVYISERDATGYRAGDEVTGFVPALNRKVKGTVRFVNAAPSFADMRMTREQGQADLTSFRMRIYTEPDPELLPGMTVELTAR